MMPSAWLAASVLVQVLATAGHPDSLAAPARPDFEARARARSEETLAARRWLHQHPELSLRERATQAWLKKRLAAVPGCELIEGDWGTGLVAIVRGTRAGPLLAYRADIDGLPLQEQTGLPFASTATDTLGGRKVGVMHACGHDLHAAILLSVVGILASERTRMPGSVLFILEPAEEIGAGAAAMIQAGLFGRVGKPASIYALHDHPTIPLGQVGYCPGYASGNVDDFYIRVLGRGGHGAYPSKTIDPVVIASEMVVAFQSIVSREIDSGKAAVVTVGSIHGGTASNVIPDAVELEGTSRSFDPEVRARLQAAVERTARGIAAAHGAPEPEIRYILGTPSMYNDPKVVDQTVPVLRRALGDQNVLRYDAALGGEDFAYFAQAIPGFMFRLGVGRPDREMSLHSPTFDPDERALDLGVRLMCEILWDRLSAPQVP